MLGFYNYTMYLTYLSLASAATGIIISLTGIGHPFIGAGLLLVCGLCDAFDGKVARTKKDRTDLERRYGIQLDSLSDIVAFLTNFYHVSINMQFTHNSCFFINLFSMCFFGRHS